jgi:hypothetical protein
MIDEAQLELLTVPLALQLEGGLQGDQANEKAEHQQEFALRRQAIQQLPDRAGYRQRQASAFLAAENAGQRQQGQEQHQPEPFERGAGQIEAHGSQYPATVESPEFG